MKTKTYPRLLLASDEKGQWYLRSIRTVMLDLDLNHKIYRCDKHLGGPYKTLEGAVKELKQLAEVRQNAPNT